MARKLIIDGNAVYEIDEQCMLKKKLDSTEEEKSLKHGKSLTKEEQNQKMSCKESASEIRKTNIK